MKNRDHFTKLSSVKLGVNKQGLVFYICRNYYNFGEGKRKIMDDAFEKAGGDYAPALKRFMTSADTAVKVCIDHNIGSEKTLYIVVRRLYEIFPLNKFMR